MLAAYSFEMARSYFTAAIAGADTPDDVRRRAAALLVTLRYPPCWTATRQPRKPPLQNPR